MSRSFSRRAFVGLVGGVGSMALLAACTPAVPPTPTPAPKPPAPAPSPTPAAAAAPAKPTATLVPPKPTVTAAPAKPTPTAAPAKPAGATVNLKIGGWFDKGTQLTVEKQLEMFRQKFPNVAVSIVQIESAVEKAVVMMASGAAPDVFWVNNDQTAPWASRKALYALDDFISRDKIDMADMFEVGKFLYSYQGKTYGLTEYLGPLMVLYNPKLFEAAGVPLPPTDYKDPKWTLDALLERAKALTKRPGSGPAEQYGLFLATSIYRWFPILWAYGADVVDSAENPTRITFDSPATYQAVQWVADLRLKHNVTSTVAEASGIPMEAQFETGRLAILIEGPWMWPRFMAAPVRAKVPWEVAPLPRGPGGVFTRIAGDAYGMWSQTRSPDLAWELLKFTTIGEGQKVNWMPELAKGIPPLRTMAKDSQFASWFAPQSRKVVMELAEYGRTSPKHANWAEVVAKLGPELDQVWVGKVPVEQAVKSAQAKMAEVFARVQG